MARPCRAPRQLKHRPSEQGAGAEPPIPAWLPQALALAAREAEMGVLPETSQPAAGSWECWAGTGCMQGMQRARRAQPGTHENTVHAQGMHRVQQGMHKACRRLTGCSRPCTRHAGYAQSMHKVCTGHAGYAEGMLRACRARRGHGCPLMAGPSTCLQQGGHGQAGTQQPSPSSPCTLLEFFPPHGLQCSSLPRTQGSCQLTTMGLGTAGSKKGHMWLLLQVEKA